MNSGREGEVSIRSESDIVQARKLVRSVAAEAGLGVTDVTRVVTAASELTRNIFHYAGEGTMTWRTLNTGARSGIELVFEDRGPGISNIDQAMERGYSTRGGLGLGLPGAKRLMDEMEIKSAPGQGTKIVVRKWLRRV